MVGILQKVILDAVIVQKYLGIVWSVEGNSSLQWNVNGNAKSVDRNVRHVPLRLTDNTTGNTSVTIALEVVQTVCVLSVKNLRHSMIEVYATHVAKGEYNLEA